MSATRTSAQDGEFCGRCGYPFDKHDQCWTDGAAVYCSERCGRDGARKPRMLSDMADSVIELVWMNPYGHMTITGRVDVLWPNIWVGPLCLSGDHEIVAGERPGRWKVFILGGEP